MPVIQTGARHSYATCFFLFAMQTYKDSIGLPPARLEADARASIESHAHRMFTEAEWAIMRAKLEEFACILRGWDREKTGSRRGNVEEPCLPER